MDEKLIRKQYEYLKHQQKTEIRIFSNKGKSIFVESVDDFVKYVKELNSVEDVYVGINERYSNNKTDDTVKILSNIFVDIDFKDVPDVEGFEKTLVDKGFKYAFKINTSGGFHYYIPISPQMLVEGENEARDEAKLLLSGFKECFRKYKIDVKVFNLSRVSKVWGTKSYKYDKIINIEKENEYNIEDKRKNMTSLYNLPRLKVYESHFTEVKHSCGFMEHYFNIKYPEGMEKNVFIHANLVPYIKSKYNDDKKARRIADEVMVFQGHNANELDSWWVKVPKFNCGAIRNWCKKYKKELEDYCWQCPKNIEKRYVKYIDGVKSWKHVKKQMIEEQLSNKYEFLFYINKHKELKGNISITEYREFTQSIDILKIFRKKADDEPDNKVTIFDEMTQYDKIVQFIDDAKPKGKNILEKPVYVHRVKFYIYDFESITNERFTVMSEKPVKIGENTIRGMEVLINDNVEIGNNIKIGSQSPILFVFDTVPSVKEIENNEELSNIVKQYNLTVDRLYNSIFYLPERDIGEEGKSYVHPSYFMELIVAFLLSSKVEGYPLHLIIIGGTGTGKSFLRKVLTHLMAENDFITSTSGNTLKGIIPSHASKKRLEIGSLLRANRLICWDEAFRILGKIENDGGGDEESEKLGDLNEILEHNNINLASGFHRISGIYMTAKCIMMTNCVRVSDDIYDTHKKVSPSFLSRFMIFFQNEKHVKYVKDGKGIIKNILTIPKNDWLSIYDYLNIKKVKVDKERVGYIVEKYKNNLTDQVLANFVGRYKSHHFLCLLDGIVKIRNLCSNEYDFEAKEEDYKKLEDLIIIMLNNWAERTGVAIISNVHKSILEYIGEKISRHVLLKWAVAESIDEVEIKFLRDNNYIKLEGNEYIPVKDRELLSDDFMER